MYVRKRDCRKKVHTVVALSNSEEQTAGGTRGQQRRALATTPEGAGRAGVTKKADKLQRIFYTQEVDYYNECLRVETITINNRLDYLWAVGICMQSIYLTWVEKVDSFTFHAKIFRQLRVMSLDVNITPVYSSSIFFYCHYITGHMAMSTMSVRMYQVCMWFSKLEIVRNGSIFLDF